MPVLPWNSLICRLEQAHVSYRWRRTMLVHWYLPLTLTKSESGTLIPCEIRHSSQKNNDSIHEGFLFLNGIHDSFMCCTPVTELQDSSSPTRVNSIIVTWFSVVTRNAEQNVSNLRTDRSHFFFLWSNMVTGPGRSSLTRRNLREKSKSSEKIISRLGYECIPVVR